MNRWPPVVGGLVVAGLVPVLLASAALGMLRQEPGDPRVRDLQYRVRDLTYRVNTLDNAERVAETPEEISVTLAADVLFEFDRADLTPEAVTRLEDLAGQLDDLGPRAVTIGGHTDSHGEEPYNQDLSERRAEAVRAQLDELLDDDFTFEVTGYGETQPVAPNEVEGGADNPEGRALNRRVEITFPT